MTKGIFEDREHAQEAHYFRQQDEQLIERLRRKASLDDIAVSLAEKLHVENPDLVARVKQLGITADTAVALFVAPLVQVAWAGGPVSRAERNTVLRLVRQRGVDASSPAYSKIVEWLANRPPNATFEAALEVLRYGFSVLPPYEREERIQGLVDACSEVAIASRNVFASLFGIGSEVSSIKRDIVNAIDVELRRPINVAR